VRLSHFIKEPAAVVFLTRIRSVWIAVSVPLLPFVPLWRSIKPNSCRDFDLVVT